MDSPPPLPPPRSAPQPSSHARDDISGPSNGEGATIDEASGAAAVRLSIWQHPFVQNVVPLLSSVLIHLGIILFAILTYKVVQIVNSPSKEQVMISDAAITEGPEGGIPHPGMNNDPTRDAAQDQVPNVDTAGTAETKTDDLTQALQKGGASGDAATDGIMAPGPLSGFNKGRGAGSGQGDNGGSGNGESSGPMAAFGVPGGGSGVGPKTKFFGVSGRAKRIVFVLDATGSMFELFEALRVQVYKAIDVLQPPQSFNVVFINESNPAPPMPQLMFVTPENKRIAKEYIKNAVSAGSTNPLPALTKAFEMKPDLIYFLIDPEDFPDKQQVLDLVHKNSGEGKVKMIIIAFRGNDPENIAFLTKLAKETGGKLETRTAKDIENAN